MEVELHVTGWRDSKIPPTAWFGSLATGGARPGGTTGSRRNPAYPAWSVADENQGLEGSSQHTKHTKRLSHHGSRGLAQQVRDIFSLTLYIYVLHKSLHNFKP